MDAMKELMGELLLDLEGEPSRKYDLEELIPVLKKCKYMSLSSILNDVTTFKYLQRFGVMDGITKLKGYRKTTYVCENKFSYQVLDIEKAFIYKMSKVEPRSGVQLVNQMQPDGGL